MKTQTVLVVMGSALVSLLMGAPPPASGQGTAFTYQGQLLEGGAPANGWYDFQFAIHNDPGGGPPQAGPLPVDAVPVSNGLFTVTLNFGGGVFDGAALWLGIEVKTNASPDPYTPLTPLQPLTAAPYAVLAGTLGGNLPDPCLAGFYSQRVTLSNSSNVFFGAYQGDGRSLSNVNATTLEGLEAGSFWNVGGNVGTAPDTHFLGTIDSQPLELRVGNTRALRLEPTVGAPNLIGGAGDNVAGDGVQGVSIGGGARNAATGYFSSVSGGEQNVVTGSYTSVGGGVGNTASGWWATVGGGDWNIAGGSDATVSGGFTNIASSSYATVSGGIGNMASGGSSTVSGGAGNLALTAYCVVGGGRDNSASGYSTTVGGGGDNTASTDYATVGGGLTNTAAGSYAVVAGGVQNQAAGESAFVGGGLANAILSSCEFAAVAGGMGNRVSSGSDSAFVGGGESNLIYTTDGGVIGGGLFNQLDECYEGAVIGGGVGNEVSTASRYATIGGGLSNRINICVSGTISGGRNNSIAPGSVTAVIGGGDSNEISVGAAAVIAGGVGNTLLEAPRGVIGGGSSNLLGYGAEASVIGGGEGNLLLMADHATIGGGLGNTVAGSSTYATIGGGYTNRIGEGVVGAAIGGGSLNDIEFNSGHATIAGGWDNRIGEGGYYATIPGGYHNEATKGYSFAAGRRAKAIHEGAFVWADSRDLDYYSTRSNEFSIRAEGGVRIDTHLGIKLNDLDRPLITRGWFPFTSGAYEGVGRFGLFMEPWTLTVGLPTHGAAGFQVVSYNTNSTINSVLMSLDSGGNMTIAGTYSPSSDRAVKRDFSAIDPLEVLERLTALPMQTWAYTNNPSVRHLGPVSQDFHAAFGLGADDRHIATVDADGVALAAIQGLHQKLEFRSRRAEFGLQELKAQNAELKRELDELKRLVNAMTRNLNGGGK